MGRLWNGDLSVTGKIIAEDFVGRLAPLSGTGPDQFHGRQPLNDWISGIHALLTARPAAIPAATSIRDAARTMVHGRFRQVPVTDGTGWIGIADIADVCGALLAPPAA